MVEGYVQRVVQEQYHSGISGSVPKDNKKSCLKPGNILVGLLTGDADGSRGGDCFPGASAGVGQEFLQVYLVAADGSVIDKPSSRSGRQCQRMAVVVNGKGELSDGNALPNAVHFFRTTRIFDQRFITKRYSVSAHLLAFALAQGKRFFLSAFCLVFIAGGKSNTYNGEK